MNPQAFDSIATSVSSEARLSMQTFARLPASVPPQTQTEFDAAAAQAERVGERLGRPALEALAPRIKTRMLGCTTALEVEPAGGVSLHAPLVFLHGGGFVQGSAGSSLLTAAVAASTSGRRVLSIDYGLAPRWKWRAVLDQVVAAWSALIDNCGPGPIGLLGESAGGCIAAATTLLLRDRGIPGPAALVLISPATDLACTGDTEKTLRQVDYLESQTLLAGYRAYAAESEAHEPLVSPLYGDFSAGFPATLIQAGTRERLLSDSVRLHRALRAARRDSRLELYEGMPHAFQSLMADTPEGRSAWSEIADFWSVHLGTKAQFSA